MSEPSRTTRRRVLGVVAAGTPVALAGCSTAGGPDQGTTDDTGATTDSPSIGTPVMGDPDADVTVAAWEDFACPHCATYNANAVSRLESTYIEPGEIRYEHHDFPLPVDPKWSWKVAIAARSVQARAGDEAFWSFTKAAFDQQSTIRSNGYGTIRSIAGDAGADGDAVVADAKDGTYRAVVSDDKSTGEGRGVEYTPYIFVNDTVVDPESGESRYDAISRLIESAK